MNAMTKLKSVEPTVILDLDEARAARVEAEAALHDAGKAVEAIAARWPAPMNDRRYLAELAAGLRHPAHDHTLSGRLFQQRDDLREFDAAVKAEDRARTALESARAVEAPLQYAADMTALGDGRTALADAIEALEQAKANVAAHGAALAKAEDAVYGLNDELARLEEDLRGAASAAAEHMRQGFLGNEYEAPKTAAEIRSEIQSLTDKRDALRAVRDALKAEAVRFGNTITIREAQVRAAVKHVVKVHPATRALARAFVEATETANSLRRAVDLLRDGMLPDGALVAPDRRDDAEAAAWRSALERLTSEAATTLPGE